MIKVNWKKIKPFEEKPFVIFAMVLLLLLLVISIVFVPFSRLSYIGLKIATAVLLFLTLAFGVKIESRMLQIYFLLGSLDIGMFFAVLLPVNNVITFFLFGVSVLLAIFSIIIPIIAEKRMDKNTKYNFIEPKRKEVFAEKNVLFLAPHEDDEINIYGGVIEEYVKNNSKVTIAFSTNGDFHKIGKTRIKEALNVAKVLGVSKENVVFLGYGDGMLGKNKKHFYNANGTELVTSKAGYKETYSIKDKPPFKQSAYTRNNFVGDILDLIIATEPDTIFCCDYDSHSDHRAISLAFEEAMDEIIKENHYYRPEVFKGFAYSTAWNGKEDYYFQNMLSTHVEDGISVMKENNLYAWKDRVRFPIEKSSLSRIMQNTKLYKAMMQYSSQTATDHAVGVLNSDKVFWKRRTDSVLYDAEIMATSGDPKNLINFKIAESDDINRDDIPSKNMWTADKNDARREILIKLPCSKKISSLAIYGDMTLLSKINNAKISFDTVSYETGELKDGGVATVFEFPSVTTSTIRIKIMNAIGNPSISHIDAFATPEKRTPSLIKLQNQNEDFCYDYIIAKSGSEIFSVYSYPNTENEYAFESDNENISVSEQEDKNIRIVCPKGESGNIKIALKDNEEIYDFVRISNPSEKERAEISFKQENELKILTYPMQMDYYRGLLRRLRMYR